MVFDLHSHSHYSDGILSPEALMSRAKACGVTHLALTDHDTLDGLPSARRAADREGVQLVPGIEFSSQWGRSGSHIVGLALDPNSAGLKAAVARQQQARVERARAIAERLTGLGYPGLLAQAQAIAGPGHLGRPHFAQALVACGAVTSVAAAFKKYLGSGKPADVKFAWPPMETVIGWIQSAGGLAVLAHPRKYSLTRTKMCALIGAFAEGGGDALELISGQQPAGMAEDLARIAKQHNLAASCGSDFHRPGEGWQELGNFGILPQGCYPVWRMPAFAGAEMSPAQ